MFHECHLSKFLSDLSACGRTLQESIDKFSFTPTNGKSATCQWRISATHGEKIVLNLTDLDIPESKQCEKHYLEVRDGHFIMSPLLGKVKRLKMKRVNVFLSEIIPIDPIV